tara:strand:- start:4553 stop:4792 length:240 start_codon:yes stop_codon:yes gene_type:complete
MDNKYTHEGGDFLSALSNLGMPLGLAVLANKIETKEEDNKSQKGGVFLSDSLLLEAGLAVVPFGLIALTESEKDSKDNK